MATDRIIKGSFIKMTSTGKGFTYGQITNPFKIGQSNSQTILINENNEQIDTTDSLTNVAWAASSVINDDGLIGNCCKSSKFI